MVASAEPAPSPAELREALRRVLPESMVPTAFVSLAALPVTANGKLDRQALPAPARREAATFAAPRTEVERVLAALFAEVLKVERVGMEESFFDLGGHSLLATQVIARLRRAFGIDLPLRKLFEHPTVAGLAREIEPAASTDGVGVGAPPPIERTDRTDQTDLPLSFAQQQLWFIDRLEGGSRCTTCRSRSGCARKSIGAGAVAGVRGGGAAARGAAHGLPRRQNGRARQVILPAAGLALPFLSSI